MLRGPLALVTGACGGIGRAVALSLGEAGVNVVVHYNASSLGIAEVG
jgi:NAD(P)-dependent dehydrogenase (short-subunit alcohol dehydrogenase family)